MLGGMAGGGMGFIFDPKVHAEAQDWLQELMVSVKQHGIVRAVRHGSGRLRLRT